jgi:hypothetical protein
MRRQLPEFLVAVFAVEHSVQPLGSRVDAGD